MLKIKMNFNFDAIILGGGGGGYTAAFELCRGGKNVLLLDPKGVLGGNCLYEGCIPSKTFWVGANSIKKQPWFQTNPTLDFSKLVDWKDKVQNNRFEQHNHELEEFSNLTFLHKKGKMVDEHTIEVDDKKYTGKHIVIATGSEPFIPNELKEGITTHELLKPETKIRNLYSNFGIIGGGYIGIEMAGMFAKFGTKVTLFACRILPSVSEEIQKLLENRLRNLGVEIVKEKGKTIMRKNNSKIVITESGERSFDEVLVAVGRKPSTENLISSLNKGKKGEILVDYSMKTNIPHIYAVGDVNGSHMLFHVAVLEGWIAAQNILEGNRNVHTMNYHAIPYAVYSDPQVAWTGLQKEDAIKYGYDIIVKRYPFSKDSRTQIENDEEGWIELVIDKETQVIIGANVVGIDADLIIGELCAVVAEKLTTFQLSRISQPHPTQLEGILSIIRKYD